MWEIQTWNPFAWPISAKLGCGTDGLSFDSRIIWYTDKVTVDSVTSGHPDPVAIKQLNRCISISVFNICLGCFSAFQPRKACRVWDVNVYSYIYSSFGWSYGLEENLLGCPLLGTAMNWICKIYEAWIPTIPTKHRLCFLFEWRIRDCILILQLLIQTLHDPPLPLFLQMSKYFKACALFFYFLNFKTAGVNMYGPSVPQGQSTIHSKPTQLRLYPDEGKQNVQALWASLAFPIL